MDVLDTDFTDARFDFVIATFLFCMLEDADQLPALLELGRVCKPDGEIRILEYAYSKNPVTRFIMRLWAPWVRLIYGATFDRRVKRYVADANLKLIEERFFTKTSSSFWCCAVGKTESFAKKRDNSTRLVILARHRGTYWFTIVF